ncbi:MAG: hypothetical protein JSS32_04170 [Verrucomicrobia bacterium]|nr:hypothetical protein [Verrucomicrobiota bacterium]
MKKIFLLLAAAILAIAIHRSVGFSLSKVLVDLPTGEELSQELPELSQPFRYLSHGRQTFVFLSADGKTVLKLFNQEYFQPRWYHHLPAPRAWKEQQRKKLALRKRFYEESYPLAFQKLRKESGLIYLHLHKTQEPLPSAELIDPSGRKIRLDLNRAAFVLQKKASSYRAHMEKVACEEGTIGLKREIDAWLAFCSHRMELKIGDHDHDIWENIGVFEDEELLFIDPGKIYANEQMHLEREWWKATHRLHKWLLKTDPEAAAYLERGRDNCLSLPEGYSSRGKSS